MNLSGLPAVAISIIFPTVFFLAAALPGKAEAQNETELPVVMVTGNREELLDVLSPGVISVAYPDDVKGEHKELSDLLDQIPGVYVRRQSGSAHYTTASIRGSAPSQVNIYVDGVPMNLANETAADISTLPISNVERVEVYRGVTPARFSGAPIGGAINIVTKKPTTFSGSVSAGKRSLGGEQYAGSLNFPLLGGHMLIGLDKDRSAGNFKYKDYAVQSFDRLVFSDGKRYDEITSTTTDFTGRRIPVDRERLNNSVEKENALFKWENRNFVFKYAQTDLDRYQPDRILSAKSGYQDHQQDLSWLGMPSAYNRGRNQTLKKREALAGWRDSFGPLDAAVNFTWLKNRQDYRDDYYWALYYGGNWSASGEALMGGMWSAYTTTRKGVSGDLAYRFNEGGAFVHQVEFHAAYTDEKLDAHLNDFKPGTSSPGSDYLSQFRRKRRELQLQDTITIPALGNFQITPIIRAEKLSGPMLGSLRHVNYPMKSGDVKWTTTGSLSFKKDFESGWQLFGSKGKYIRYPNFYEIYGNGFGMIPGAGSDHRLPLLPERGETVDAGFGWQGRLSEKTRANFRLTWFQRDVKFGIALVQNPIVAQYINSGPTVHRGLELEGGLALGNRADLQFAVTKQDAHFTGRHTYFYYSSTNENPGTRYPGEKVRYNHIPDFVANVRLNLRFFDKALSTFVEANRVGRVYTDVKTWENPLTLWNLGGSWLFAKTGPAKGARLSFGVNDVFNRGPKQTMGGEGRQLPTAYTWSQCSTPSNGIINIPPGGEAPGNDYYGCKFGPGTGSEYESSFPAYSVVVHRENPTLKSNVLYPREGRVYYVTLAWMF